MSAGPVYSRGLAVAASITFMGALAAAATWTRSRLDDRAELLRWTEQESVLRRRVQDKAAFEDPTMEELRAKLRREGERLPSRASADAVLRESAGRLVFKEVSSSRRIDRVVRVIVASMPDATAGDWTAFVGWVCRVETQPGFSVAEVRLRAHGGDREGEMDEISARVEISTRLPSGGDT